MKKLELLLFTSFMFFASAQNMNIGKIDSALDKAKIDVISSGVSYPKMVDLSLQLASASEKINYKQGAIKSYIEAGKYLFNQGKYAESIRILDKANSINNELEDKGLQSALFTEYGKNYQQLGFYERSTENFNLAVKFIKNSNYSTADINYALRYIYGCKASVFQVQDIRDSLYVNLIKSDSVFPSPLISARLARYSLLHKNDMEEALKLLQKAEKLLISQNNIRDKSIILRIYGLYYFKLKDYPKSITYYNQSISISKKLGMRMDETDTAKLLYDSYNALDDKQKQLELLQKYSSLTDQLSQEEKDGATIVINELKDKEENNNLNYLYWLLGGFFVICLIIIGWYFSYKKYRKKLNKKRQQIIEKEIEKSQLKIQVNSSFDQIIELAKQNHPNFYVRFQEVYPAFQSKLLSIDPQLQISELILLAYIYLNFESKEIAEYTFKSYRTIQNRKYRLRKKLGISTSEDITIWLKVQFS